MMCWAINDRHLLRQRWDSGIWMLKGRRLPPPAAFKQLVIARLAGQYGLSRMVETGTHYGDMVEAMKSRFGRIDTIEIHEPLYRQAVRRFEGCNNVHLHLGDSETILPALLADLTQPALFWLDAHYSGEGTGKGDQETPIWKELKCILAHPVGGHVVLIDDARLFVGRDGYPSIGQLGDFVQAQAPQRPFEVRDDIVRIHPL